jgi:hypothetical protein
MRTWIIFVVMAGAWDSAPFMTTAPLLVRIGFGFVIVIASLAAVAQDINELFE